MSVLAFLQNAYTSSAESAAKLEKSFEDPNIAGFMQRLRKDGLFDGQNYTGLTIKRIFGEKVCDAIWWENASPQWGWESKHKFPADMDHIRRLCKEHNPSVVLTFGAVARDALLDLKLQLDSPLEFAVIISGPHPACRQPDKFEQLRRMNAKLLEEVHFLECQHCHRLAYGGSHCNHCYKSLEWEPTWAELEGCQEN